MIRSFGLLAVGWVLLLVQAGLLLARLRRVFFGPPVLTLMLVECRLGPFFP